jgi:hypothetical protein
MTRSLPRSFVDFVIAFHHFLPSQASSLLSFPFLPFIILILPTKKGHMTLQ